MFEPECYDFLDVDYVDSAYPPSDDKELSCEGCIYLDHCPDDSHCHECYINQCPRPVYKSED